MMGKSRHLRAQRQDGSEFDVEIGLDPLQIGRLFNAFEQADGSTTRRFGGSGLGLAISHSLVALMGGEIRVKSEPQAGSRFEVRLPLDDAALPVAAPDPSACLAGQRLSGFRVLAAEDNEINRLVLEELLGAEGAILLCVEDGAQAVERLLADGEGAWDILLTDIQMPVMDSFEASRRIREHGIDLPIVGLTAHVMPEERAKCLAFGMVEHVGKPIDIDHLVAVILRHTLRHALREPHAPLAADPGVPVIPPKLGTESSAGEDRLAGSPTDLDADDLLRVDSPLADIIDWHAQESRFPGKRDFVTRLAVSVMRSHGETPHALRRAAEAGDFATLAFTAHSLKGIAGNPMAHGVHEMAREADQAAREGRADTVALALTLAEGLEKLLAATALRIGRETGDQVHRQPE